MLLVKKQNNESYSIPCKEISPQNIAVINSNLAQRILKKIAEKPNYPKEIAKQLNVHEQKVYYHIRKLEKSGLIHHLKKEIVRGAVSVYYELTAPSFAVRFKELESTKKIANYSNESEFLEPFIKDGKLKALIVVGSPDPHGPEKARSRDGYYGMDLALFLGTFLSYVPEINVRLDTEITEQDLRNNLIIIGGPIVNTITAKVNRYLPINFTGKSIKSSISNKEYFSDETGFVTKVKNPFDKSKDIMVIAGKRHSGTRSIMIAFLKRFDELIKGNILNNKINAKVVEGVDLDSDGVVDDIEILE